MDISDGFRRQGSPSKLHDTYYLKTFSTETFLLVFNWKKYEICPLNHDNDSVFSKQ